MKMNIHIEITAPNGEFFRAHKEDPIEAIEFANRYNSEGSKLMVSAHSRESQEAYMILEALAEKWTK